MGCTEHRLSCKQVETLMDLSAAMGDYMHSLECAREVPGCLSRVLRQEAVTLAVIRQSADDAEPQVLMCGTSVKLAEEGAEALKQYVTAIFHRTRPLTKDEAPALREVVQIDESVAGGFLASHPRAVVFARSIDGVHRLLLVVHQGAQDAQFTTATTDNLLLISQVLARQIHCLLAWESSPQALGEPFVALTEREWTVLRSLNSDVGEKQLADQLGLSPHTLHSHIKSIYRKVGVQGRLSLIRKFHTAVRDLRLRLLSAEEARRTAAPVEAAVAAS